MKFFYSLLILCLLSLSTGNSQPWVKNIESNLNSKSKTNFYQIKSAFEDYWNDKEITKGKGFKQFKRWEYFWDQRLWPTGKFPESKSMFNEVSRWHDSRKTQDNILAASWTELGPTTIPNNKLNYQSSGMGRLSCIRFSPTDENTIWVGAASGGIWRSTNAGISWTPLNFSLFQSIGISDIAISPSLNTTIYAATGDANGSFMSSCYSIGILKSSNGGATWAITNGNHELQENFLATRLLVNPQNSEEVLAASNTGIYKTTDGGQSWSLKQGDAYFKDMEFKPNNHNIIYASTQSTMGYCEIYKSTNGGDSWSLSKTINDCNRIELAVTNNSIDNVYAVCSKASSDGFGGMYVSTNSGGSWTLVSSTPNILGINDDGSSTDGQGSYDLTITVSPTDKNLIYVGGIQIWKSQNGGSTWSVVNDWQGINYPFVHADQHDLVFGPTTGNLYSANDGGFFNTMDGGTTWADLSSGLRIAQFYRIGCSASDESTVFGGTQDNGTQRLSNNIWDHVRGADGMECIVDNINPMIVYASAYYGSIFRSTDGGNTFNMFMDGSFLNPSEKGDWVTPYVMDPNNHNIIYVGYQNIWKVTNGTPQKISDFPTNIFIKSIAVAPSNSNYIYISFNGTVQYTTNGGTSWNNLNDFNQTVSYIAVDPMNEKHVFISLSGYMDNEKVYDWNNKALVNISGNLPNIPINCIVYQKNTPDRIFIGTDAGVYVRDDVTNNWSTFNTSMPLVIIDELEIFYGSGFAKLRAATFGRGLWESPIDVCNIPKPTINILGTTTFCAGDSLVLSIQGDYSSYKWSNNEITKQIVIKNQGNYSVIVTDNKNCVSQSDTIKVTVNPVPNLKITANTGTNICNGDTATLSASIGFVKYTWNTGDTTKSIKVSNAGEYWVTGETTKGCQKVSEHTIITIIPSPDKPIITRTGVQLSVQTGFKSYQWYINNLLISGATTSNFTPTSNGRVTVKVTNNQDCSVLSDPFDFNSGIDEISTDSDILIFPNPASNQININLKNIKDNYIEIRLCDILGRQLISIKEDIDTGNYTKTIDLSGIPRGLYLIKLKSGSNFYIEKIVIE